MSMSMYAPARGCDAELNTWCNKYCVHSETHGPLLARFDGTLSAPKAAAWRCYAPSTLSSDGQKFVGGSEYCTRNSQLLEVLDKCSPEGTRAYSIDTGGSTRRVSRDESVPVPKASPQSRPQPSSAAAAAAAALRSRPPLPSIRAPSSMRRPTSPTPHYEHSANFMRLPPSLKLPRLENCHVDLVRDATFWAASLYTSSYAMKAVRLVASCEHWGICCQPALMPDGALEGVAGKNEEGSYALRHRLIASKPLFILNVLQSSPLPLAWLDVDLEFHAFPTLFTPQGWDDFEPRDVLMWNWQSDVPAFSGRR